MTNYDMIREQHFVNFAGDVAAIKLDISEMCPGPPTVFAFWGFVVKWFSNNL